MVKRRTTRKTARKTTARKPARKTSTRKTTARKTTARKTTARKTGRTARSHSEDAVEHLLARITVDAGQAGLNFHNRCYRRYEANLIAVAKSADKLIKMALARRTK